MVRSVLGILLVGLFATHGAIAESRGSRDEGPLTVSFPYRQRQLLRSTDPNGGLAYVTSGATRGATLPVVVFLHGMNSAAEINMWFGAPRTDLRGVAEELVRSRRTMPFILAAPTHTRFATGQAVMWPRFDLSDFLAATETALGGQAHVDPRRVVVVGHSAAGCNPTGGIVSDGVKDARPMAVVAIDTCALPELAAVAESVPVSFYWQHLWNRPVEELGQRCTGCLVEEVAELPRGSAHDAILPVALRRSLATLLAPPSG